MLKDGINGFCMALADSVPGVSGGTVAFIMGMLNTELGYIFIHVRSLITEYIAKAFMEPRDYRVVFLIQKGGLSLHDLLIVKATAPLSCLKAKTGGAVNSGRSPFILLWTNMCCIFLLS